MASRPRTSSVRDHVLAFAPAVLILALVIWSARLFGRADEGRQWVRHTEAVLTSSSAALSYLQDAEAGQRGFLASGNESYLEPFRRGRDSLGLELARLRSLTSDDDRQQRLLSALGPIVARRLGQLDSGSIRRRQGAAAVAMDVVRQGLGKQLMDSARTLIAQLRAEENRLLDERSIRERADHDTLKVGLLIGVLFSAAISYLVASRFSRQATRQRQISEELAKRNNTLQEQAVEIETANQQLQSQQAALETANQQLQEQQLALELGAEHMKQRSAELSVAREELREANDAKTMFLANVSPELFTPLNAIAGQVELMQMGVHGPVSDDQRAALDRIARAQRHLLDLLNDIRNFTSLKAGRVQFTIGEVDVGQTMREVSAVVEPQMAAAGLSFSNSFANETYLVKADAEWLRQILVNLFSNATKFTPMGGRVSFGVGPHETDSSLVELRVSDTGIGIAADKLDHMFQPFVQLAAVPSHQGVGLGLAISRDLARGMGGDLTAWSSEGLGSTFTLTLQRAGRQEQMTTT